MPVFPSRSTQEIFRITVVVADISVSKKPFVKTTPIVKVVRRSAYIVKLLQAFIVLLIAISDARTLTLLL